MVTLDMMLSSVLMTVCGRMLAMASCVSFPMASILGGMPLMSGRSMDSTGIGESLGIGRVGVVSGIESEGVSGMVRIFCLAYWERVDRLASRRR